MGVTARGLCEEGLGQGGAPWWGQQLQCFPSQGLTAPFCFGRAPLKLLCDNMKYQILSRAFYGCEYLPQPTSLESLRGAWGEDQAWLIKLILPAGCGCLWLLPACCMQGAFGGSLAQVSHALAVQ